MKKKKNSRIELVSQSNLKSKGFVMIGAVLIITFILFLPALKNNFTNWDDNLYVTENPAIKSISFDHLDKFSENFVGNFHPLTMLSLAIDYHFFKLDPFYFHLKNIFFHLLNTLLVFIFIKRISRNLYISLLTALIFGIHPMHVESVAWVAERKDVLYTFYFLVGLLFYHKYISGKRILFFVLTIISFLLSTLCKSAAVVFPVVLLLIDQFEGRKFTVKSIAEKIPLFLYSVYIGIIALNTQSDSNAIGDFQFYSLVEKIRFAGYGFINYLVKFFFPFHLSPFHPYPDKNNIPLSYNLALIAVLIVIIYLFIKGRKNKWLLFGIVFYFVTIALVLQFITVGNAIVSERYTYVPYIGIGFIYSTCIVNLTEKYRNNNNKFLLWGFLFIQLLYFAGTTHNRIKIWKDSASLWTDVIEKYPEESGAYENRGNFYHSQNKNELALQDYNISIHINDKSYRTFYNRGKLWADTKQFEKALSDYNKSIELNDKYALAYAGRGATYYLLKKLDEALTDLTKAIELDPKNTYALNIRGYVYFQLKEYQKNIDDYRRILQIQPNDAKIINSIGYCYFMLKQNDMAISEYNKAILLNPSNGAFYLSRSYAFNEKGDKNNALNDAIRAQQLGHEVNSNYINYLKQ